MGGRGGGGGLLVVALWTLSRRAWVGVIVLCSWKDRRRNFSEGSVG